MILELVLFAKSSLKKIDFSKLRIYLGISLIVLASSFQTINVADRLVLPIIRNKTIGKNTIIMYDATTQELRKLLPKRGFVSYIDGYKGQAEDRGNRGQIQFSLLPVILQAGNHPWAVGDFPPGKRPEIAYIDNEKYILLKDFNNGLCLFKNV